jgi:hypothetical protein
MYPVIALIVLTLFTWIVAIWASFGDSDAPHDVEKAGQSSDEHDRREGTKGGRVPNARWRSL